MSVSTCTVVTIVKTNPYVSITLARPVKEDCTLWKRGRGRVGDPKAVISDEAVGCPLYL